MIKSTLCYTIICDSCGANLYEDHEYIGYSDVQGVREEAIDSDWIVQGDKDYCEDCYSYDDDDNLVIKRALTKG